VRIAYQVRGDGPLDVVYIMAYLSNFEIELEDVHHASFIDGLGSLGRVILFDKRGSGLSDRNHTPDLEMRADDLKAVLDEVAAQRVVLYGAGEGGALGAFFAATYPDRVLALVAHHPPARVAWAADYPYGLTRDWLEADWTDVTDRWGSYAYAKDMVAGEIPSRAADDTFVHWFARCLRHSASPSAALAFNQVWYDTDVRAVLGSVQTPTLAIARSGLAPDMDSREQTQDFASRIPGAKYLEIPGHDFADCYTADHAVADAVRQFVTSIQTEESSFDRVLATVLFTDIVGSTQTAADLGDADWKALLERHHATVRALIGRYRGVEIGTAGDGFLATFDGPARGVRCAQAVIDAVRGMGLEVRTGLHTGEIERIDDSIGGLGVHIAARVGSLAGPSEVLVSSTVKDLVAGSGLTFQDRGDHALKGVPDRWHLYSVVDQAGSSAQ
jgi:class 3 adenylate cyclase